MLVLYIMFMFTMSDARRLSQGSDVNFDPFNQWEGVIYGVTSAILFCLTLNARLDKNTKMSYKMDDMFTVINPYKRALYIQRL